MARTPVKEAYTRISRILEGETVEPGIMTLPNGETIAISLPQFDECARFTIEKAGQTQTGLLFRPSDSRPAAYPEDLPFISGYSSTVMITEPARAIVWGDLKAPMDLYDTLIQWLEASPGSTRINEFEVMGGRCAVFEGTGRSYSIVAAPDRSGVIDSILFSCLLKR